MRTTATKTHSLVLPLTRKKHLRTESSRVKVSSSFGTDTLLPSNSRTMSKCAVRRFSSPGNKAIRNRVVPFESHLQAATIRHRQMLSASSENVVAGKDGEWKVRHCTSQDLTVSCQNIGMSSMKFFTLCALQSQTFCQRGRMQTSEYPVQLK
jgi:hypothetical protein